MKTAVILLKTGSILFVLAILFLGSCEKNEGDYCTECIRIGIPSTSGYYCAPTYDALLEKIEKLESRGYICDDPW